MNAALQVLLDEVVALKAREQELKALVHLLRAKIARANPAPEPVVSMICPECFGRKDRCMFCDLCHGTGRVTTVTYPS